MTSSQQPQLLWSWAMLLQSTSPNSISIRRRLSIQKTGDPIFVLELALYFSVHVVLGNGNIKRKNTLSWSDLYTVWLLIKKVCRRSELNGSTVVVVRRSSLSYSSSSPRRPALHLPALPVSGACNVDAVAAAAPTRDEMRHCVRSTGSAAAERNTILHWPTSTQRNNQRSR